MAAALVSPRLNFDGVYANLQAGHMPPAKLPLRWTPDGPITALKFLKTFFGGRLAAYPGKGGALLTPRQYARMLHRYTLAAKQPGALGHHDRFERSLKEIISLSCQNPRAGRCNQKTALGPPRIGKIGRRAGLPLPPRYAYIARDINPGCSVASAALFALLYGKTGVAMPHLNAANAKNVARNVSIALTSRRQKSPAGAYPSASCPCLNNAACAAAVHCSWVAAPAGPPGIPGFPATGACVPSSNVGAGSQGFPGVANLAGQRFPVAAKAVTQRRTKSCYTKRGNTYWRRPTVAVLPTIAQAGTVPPWP
jgi:hypothetical protein